MTAEEAQVVLAHEVGHVTNGDMVRLALIQAWSARSYCSCPGLSATWWTNSFSKLNTGTAPHFGLPPCIAEVVLGFLASVVVMWFSRQREFRADAGGASLAGRQKMIAALERLKAQQSEARLPSEIRALGIAGGGRGLM